jgi:YidC/Oxa1 family membrane protein insertase
MDQQTKRTMLAVGLMALVLILYQMLLVPQTPVEPPPAERAADPPPRPAAPAAPPVAAPAVPEIAPPSDRPRPPQHVATVGSPLYRAVVSSEGGKLQEMTLHYRGEKPLVVIGETGPTGLVIGAREGAGEVVPMEIDARALTLGPEQRTGALTMTGQVGDLRVRQTLTFSAEHYVIDIDLRVQNTGKEARAVTLALPWTSRQSWREAPPKFTGQHPSEIVWQSGGAVSRTGGSWGAGDLCSVPPLATEGEWIAMGSTWYMAAFIPRAGGFTLGANGTPGACEAAGKEPVGRATAAVQASPTIAPGQAWEGRVSMYVGPKEYDRLQALGLQGAIDFGGFPVPRNWGGLPMEWVGVPILRLMNWVYGLVGNYGIAIIILTVITKVLFFPLTVKSMRSMKAMQALGPQVNTLRNKYKNDPQRLQRETLELYRTHRVNPMGGCLPMVAQIPVFYALYLALSVSVELQNASFLCFGRIFGADVWICDLAAQDPTYVLPILMGVTMFIQQKMTPVAGDPRQARMMLIMPFVFTFMFLSLPSGLVLYWTVSNILQIAQQWYMDRPRSQRAAREAKDASRA